MLYLITDDTGRRPDQLAHIVSQAIAGVVTAVQFREKNLAGRLLADAYQAVAAACRGTGIPLYLNSDIATRIDCEITCEGIHYNNRTLPLHPAAVAPLAGYSAHEVEEALAAFHRGVEFCTISPVYPTPSKLGLLEAIGLEGLAKVRAAVGPTLKLIALGGIDATNAAPCITAGANGVAVIRALMDAPDPAAAAFKLRTLIEQAYEKRRTV